ncbi:hypothetical protein B0J14DRAFT_470836, partial [Halenospora varia]
LPYDDLPKMILDAFYVARNLGMEYIWVDSLCIIQDNDNNLQKELRKMLQIYWTHNLQSSPQVSRIAMLAF